MQAGPRYLPSHRRECSTLDNVVGEIPTTARATTPQMIFAQTNPPTQPGAYEGGIFFQWRPEVHYAAFYRSEWQQKTTSSTSSLVAFWATNHTRFMSNQRGGAGFIWAMPLVNWPLGVLQTLSRNDR